MSRTATTRLREQNEPGPIAAPVIDASFKVVKGETLRRRLWRGFLTFAFVAGAGLLVPPLWILVHRVGEMLGR